MFGMNKITTKADTTTKPVDHFAEMKAAVHRAASIAEDNGVSLALIRNFFGGCHNNYIQRAEVAIDVARAKAQAPNDSVARAQAVRAARAERQLEAERQEYRDAVNRAADAEDARRGSR